LSDSAYLFDANVWIALAFAAHPHHERAAEFFSSASPARPACFCRATQQSFLRLASTPAVLRLCNAVGLTNRDALEALRGFVSSSAVAYREEGPGIEAVWHRLAGVSSASPKVWMDAYLAAFAIAGDLELVTFDGAFTSFEGLRVTVLVA
jgi:toxin-antitoxin system PIN domain toxin